MKNILLGAILILTFLPQVSFGATIPPVVVSPQVTACNQQVDAISSAFWAQQVQERETFGKTNQAALTRHQQHFSGMLAMDMARRQGKSTTGIPAPPPDDSSVAAFIAQQQGEKNAFLAKLAQQRANCLLGINPS